jgi:hypothetical protein
MVKLPKGALSDMLIQKGEQYNWMICRNPKPEEQMGKRNAHGR